MNDNEARKRELIDKLSDAAIGLAYAQEQVAYIERRLATLKAEYDGIKALEAREEALQ